MKRFLVTAIQPTIVRRATLYALVVGPVLVFINHGDAILAGQVSARRVWKMAITFLVPYVVSTLSSMSAAGDKAIPVEG